MAPILKYAANLVGEKSSQADAHGAVRGVAEPQIDSALGKAAVPAVGEFGGVLYYAEAGAPTSTWMAEISAGLKDGERPIISENTLGTAILFLTEINGANRTKRPLLIVINSPSNTACAIENIEAAPLRSGSRVAIINPMGKLERVGPNGHSFNQSAVGLFEY